MERNVATFLGFEDEYNESEIVLFGAPFDGTTSFRPGTRFAPSVMRKESYGLETFSPYLEKDQDNYQFFDSGYLDLPFGNPEKVLEMVEEHSKRIIDDKKKVLMIGGEHLLTFGTIKACVNRYNDLAIIHFDAHADLRNDYLGEMKSHATVLRRCNELLQKESLFQFGIRSGTREEFEYAIDNTYMERFSINTIGSIIDKLKDRPVYVTIDLDILDPSVFPGTGTPEPGGVSFKELMEAFQYIQKLNIVGADVVELSPPYDQSGIATAAACKVVRELSLAMVK